MHCKLNDDAIVNPNQMPKQIIAQDPKLKRVKERNITIQRIHSNTIEFNKLRAMELKLQQFIPFSQMRYDYDDYIEKVYQHGRFMYGDRCTLDIGKPNQCHKNTIELYELNKDVTSIATGFAWIQGDLWVQHSWLIHWIDNKRTKFDIVETTLKRNAYFGVILNEAEAEQFIRYVYS